MSLKHGQIFTIGYLVVASNVFFIICKLARVLFMDLHWTKSSGDSWFDTVGIATLTALLLYIPESSRIDMKRVRVRRMSNDEDATMI